MSIYIAIKLDNLHTCFFKTVFKLLACLCTICKVISDRLHKVFCSKI